MQITLVIVVVLVALAFDYTNGFHDAANAIATSVSTRALAPRVALALAAVMNLLGAFLGQGVAHTIGSGVITPSLGRAGLAVVLAALLGAITWNVLTWWWGLPSSSTHALVGGLAGAALAASAAVHWMVILTRVVLPMIVSPLIGLVLAFGLMTGIQWAFRHANPDRANRRFRVGQTVSAAGVALGHGLQDGQKTMGVILLTLVTGGLLPAGSGVPLWVIAISAAAITLGTWSGGWRVIRTLGRRLIDLDPARGFTAEVVSAAVLSVAACASNAPISTTYTVTAAVAGAGATRRTSAVRWGVARRIAVAWVLTLPASAAAAALSYMIMKPMLT